MNQNKSIFITGAAAGIGRSTALLFAKKGWFVGLFDIDEQALASLHKEIGEKNSCYKVMDVTDAENIQSAVNFFTEHTDGTMDVLFNNAGILRMGRFEKLTIAEHKKTIDVNINGIINCIHICFNILKQTPGAYIINMSSGSSVFGAAEHSSYSATKFAVRSLTESLNIEFEPYDIMVSDVMPLYVQTPMITNQKNISASVDKFGVRLTPEKVAQYVWKAAHGKKIHWGVGFLVKASVFVAPFTSIMRKINKI